MYDDFFKQEFLVFIFVAVAQGSQARIRHELQLPHEEAHHYAWNNVRDESETPKRSGEAILAHHYSALFDQRPEVRLHDFHEGKAKPRRVIQSRPHELDDLYLHPLIELVPCVLRIVSVQPTRHFLAHQHTAYFVHT